MSLTTRNPSLTAYLRDPDGKRITQSLEAHSPDELRDKIDGRIHDLLIANLVIAALYGVTCSGVIAFLTWTTSGNLWVYPPMSIGVLVAGWVTIYPTFQRRLAWRNEWMRVRKESFDRK
jgi:hypothetical protein